MTRRIQLEDDTCNFEIRCREGGPGRLDRGGRRAISKKKCRQKCAEERIAHRREQKAAVAALKALGEAAESGDVDAARKAIKDGRGRLLFHVNADVFKWNGKFESLAGGHSTAAYVAASNGHSGVLDVLLSAPASADPDKGNTRTGSTPCHAAALYGRADAVRVLLAHGADPNRTDKMGITPCMFAAGSARVACLKALVEGTIQQGKTLLINAVVQNPGFKIHDYTGPFLAGKTGTALDFADGSIQRVRDGFLQYDPRFTSQIGVARIVARRDRALAPAKAAIEYLLENGALRAKDLP